MKAERKHEQVETNELADNLTKLGEWLQQNFAPIALLIGAAVVGGVAYSLIFAEKPIDAPAGDWNKYILALSDAQPEKELQLLVDEIQDQRSPVIVQAKLTLASLQLADACKQQFEDRKAAAAALEKAKANFEAVDLAATDSYSRNRARLGLAAVLESQNKPDEAQKYYEQVSKSGSQENAFAKLAANDHKRLESKENRDFLNWFAKQEPVARRNPHANFPFDPQTPLPETKDFSLPSLPPGEGALDKPFIPGLNLPGKTDDKVESKDEPAKTEAPKEEAAKPETPKDEPAKTEPEKTDAKTTESAPETKAEPK